MERGEKEICIAKLLTFKLDHTVWHDEGGKQFGQISAKNGRILPEWANKHLSHSDADENLLQLLGRGLICETEAEWRQNKSPQCEGPKGKSSILTLEYYLDFLLLVTKMKWWHQSSITVQDPGMVMSLRVSVIQIQMLTRLIKAHLCVLVYNFCFNVLILPSLHAGR